MTNRPDPAAFADLLAGYCLEATEQQQILIRSTTLAAPLLLELQRALLHRGAFPLMRTELPEATYCSRCTDPARPIPGSARTQAPDATARRSRRLTRGTVRRSLDVIL